MADLDFKALALQAMAEGEKFPPNADFHQARAQTFWAAHNATLLENLAVEIDDLGRTIRMLADVLEN